MKEFMVRHGLAATGTGLLILLLSLVMVPSSAQAATLRTGDRVSISSGETIDDDLYVAGGTLDVDGTVNGDLVIAGGDININGTIKGDLIAAGGNVTLKGSVDDDVRLAGGQLQMRGTIGDDLFVSGGDIDLAETSSVGGDTRIAGGSVRLAGKANEINAAVGELFVAKTAVVGGNLTYWADAEATVEDGANIGGKLNFNKASAGDKWWKGRAAGSVISLIGMIVFAWLFQMFFPRKSREVAESFNREYGINLLWGFLFVLALPVVAVLLMVTVIGMPLGIVALLAYPFVLYLGSLAMVIAVGQWVGEALNIHDREKMDWLPVILGAVAVTLLQLIPYVGWIGFILVFLGALGALLRFDWATYKQLHGRKS